MTRLVLAFIALLALAAPAGAADNPYLKERVLNMTHQGGEDEYPSNTMYAYRESLARGADSIELDVQPTKDGKLVALHDASVKRTTGVDRSTYDMTLAEVQALDAAHQFVPGRGTVSDDTEAVYPLRGVRTGAKPPPLGYSADDFRIPSLEEVLRAFPDIPINVEIKGRSDSDPESFNRNADLLVALLKRVPHKHLVVVSFQQAAVDRFHAAMPDVPVAPGIAGVAQFIATGIAPPGSVALQVPPAFSGLVIMTPDFVKRAHAAGLAVHVWFSGQEESERVYNEMLDMGVDGLMPAKPNELEKVLCARKTVRPDDAPGHCDRGRKAAARTCVARVTSGSRTLLRLRRRGPLTVACGGTVRLRTKTGKSLGAARFRFPYGLRSTTVALGRRRGATAVTRVAGGGQVTRNRL